MANKYTFILLGFTGTTIKQLQFSRLKISILVLLLNIGFFALGYGVVDYIDIRTKMHGKKDIESELARQTEEVLHQRGQIQQFAKEINTFKEKLVELDQFKKSIRIVANVDRPNDSKDIFGVGGSAPEDLNPSIDLTQKQQRLIKDMHQQMEQLNKATSAQRDDLESLLTTLEAQRNLLAHTPAIRPAEGWISSKFGYRKSPFTNKQEFHSGLDIANRKGAPIVATAYGVVTHVGPKGLLGNVIVIDHGYGITTRYAHLDKILNKPGDEVKRGAVIAHMGNSGRSTGPHLHYEVRLNGVPMNPAKYILE